MDIYKGPVFEVKRVEVLLPSGESAMRDMISHPGAVAILPFLPDGSLLLVEQIRHAVGGPLIEIPAGLLEPGEDPITCAKRELQEEIGYYPGTLHPMGMILPNAGISNEKIHLFAAADLTPSRLYAEDTHEITVKHYSFDSLLDEIESEKIIDAKTIIAVYRWLWKKRKKEG